MKKLKRGFRKFFLIATVISLIFASCKQPVEEGKGKTDKVIITVKKDAYVVKAPDSLSVDKGSKLTFDQLKDKMSLKFEASYELSKITLNDASGAEITNATPYVFNADTTIYLSSGKQNLEKVRLAKLEVAGKSIEIADVMDAGKHKEDKVSLEAKAIPGDAVVEFDQDVKDGFLRLEVGKKNLKIKGKKGSK